MPPPEKTFRFYLYQQLLLQLGRFLYSLPFPRLVYLQLCPEMALILLLKRAVGTEFAPTTELLKILRLDPHKELLCWATAVIVLLPKVVTPSKT